MALTQEQIDAAGESDAGLTEALSALSSEIENLASRTVYDAEAMAVVTEVTQAILSRNGQARDDLIAALRATVESAA